jgi:hypothetical protein
MQSCLFKWLNHSNDAAPALTSVNCVGFFIYGHEMVANLAFRHLALRRRLKELVFANHDEWWDGYVKGATVTDVLSAAAASGNNNARRPFA